MCACKTLIDPGHCSEVTVQEPAGAAVQPTSDGLRYGKFIFITSITNAIISMINWYNIY